jgi:hypothetical protein
MKEFPWLVYSTISKFCGDIGYGFHLFLAPFTLLQDETLGIKLAAALETAVVLVILYVVLRRHRLPYAFAWPFYLLFLGPPITHTFMMTRPQTLTMGFSALLLSFMVRGPALGVLSASFAIAFLHLNAFPLVLVIVLGVAVVKSIVESQREWGKWLSALAGIGAGWALRPNPLGVAKLEYHQIIVHEVTRQAQIPLLFGREWSPVSVPALGAFAVPLLLWIVASLVLLVAVATPQFKAPRNERTFLWSTVVLSALFFAAMVLTTRRFTPFWAIYAVIGTAAAFAVLLGRYGNGGAPLASRAARLTATVAMVGVFVGLAWGALKTDAVHVSWARAIPRSVRMVAGLLRDNGTPGEIVCNLNWGMFPELFFSNTEDYYVSGLDPVFLYAYDQQLYWKFHHIASGAAVERTYSGLARSDSTAVDTYAFLHDDLHASYVLLDRRRHRPLDAHLQGDPRFSLVLAEQDLALYAVGDEPAPSELPGAPINGLIRTGMNRRVRQAQEPL